MIWRIQKSSTGRRFFAKTPLKHCIAHSLFTFTRYGAPMNLSPDLPMPPVHSLTAATTLAFMRFPAPETHKAAILPFYWHASSPRFVVYAPVPQQEGEHGKLLPYQIARGTIRAQYRHAERVFWQDKGRGKPPEGAQWLRDETPAQAALREAQEEVGLPLEGITTLYDCGLLPYQNPRGSVYRLHMFLAHIPDATVLTFPDPYACAARLDGITIEQARTLAEIPQAETSFERRPFKPSYLTLLEALHDTVVEHCTL
jgi:ADP-ribose pyrophosphatase YjhB (NUDIX family)